MKSAFRGCLAAAPERTRKRQIPPVVSSPKTSAAYQAHSYPTKIPPEAITSFIEACTRPGGVVLDPFCGSGMTGVAALASGRSAVLSDLSPGAVHLARNHTQPVPPARLYEQLAAFETRWMRRAERRLYGTSCPSCSGSGLTRHLIWSDVHRCPGCGDELCLWDYAADGDRSVPRVLKCRRCGQAVRRSGTSPLRSVPVQKVVACDAGCGRLQTGPVGAQEAEHLAAMARRRLRYWFPAVTIGSDREMYRRSALQLRGISNLRDFYSPRARLALSQLWSAISETRPRRLREALEFAFTNTAWHASRMRRYNALGGQRPLTGTLYIPQLVAEANVFEVFRHQLKQVADFYDHASVSACSQVTIRRSSAADLGWLPADVIDYVFTDPPFGSNIFYADCNLIWEAWLGSVTDTKSEMVVNRSLSGLEGGKSVADYSSLLEKAFVEIRRVLRPSGRASIVFHNSDDRVWSGMLRAAEAAGLRQMDVSIIDKVQRSMKGYRGRAGHELVPFYDLVITFSPGRVRSPHLNGAGELAEEAVRGHLGYLHRAGITGLVPERGLDYLYSIAVAHVVERNTRPDGLSYRAFESLCNSHFDRVGQSFFV